MPTVEDMKVEPPTVSEAFRSGDGGITSLDISPSRDFVAIHNDKTAKIFLRHYQEGEEEKGKSSYKNVFSYKMPAEINCCKFSKDSHHCAFGGINSLIVVSLRGEYSDEDECCWEVSLNSEAQKEKSSYQAEEGEKKDEDEDEEEDDDERWGECEGPKMRDSGTSDWNVDSVDFAELVVTGSETEEKSNNNNKEKQEESSNKKKKEKDAAFRFRVLAQARNPSTNSRLRASLVRITIFDFLGSIQNEFFLDVFDPEKLMSSVRFSHDNSKLAVAVGPSILVYDFKQLVSAVEKVSSSSGSTTSEQQNNSNKKKIPQISKAVLETYKVRQWRIDIDLGWSANLASLRCPVLFSNDSCLLYYATDNGGVTACSLGISSTQVSTVKPVCHLDSGLFESHPLCLGLASGSRTLIVGDAYRECQLFAINSDIVYHHDKPEMHERKTTAYRKMCNSIQLRFPFYSLAFVDPTRLLAGSMGGHVYVIENIKTVKWCLFVKQLFLAVILGKTSMARLGEVYNLLKVTCRYFPG